MSKIAAQANDIVRLNVGGKEFTTTKVTLMMHKDTFFYNMFHSPHFEQPEVWFIDRNPKLFEIILEFFRTGEIYIDDLPERKKRMLMREIDFYQISALQDLLTEKNDYGLDENEIYSPLMKGIVVQLKNTSPDGIPNIYKKQYAKVVNAKNPMSMVIAFEDGREFYVSSDNIVLTNRKNLGVI
eukprot:TRINITY_DN286_c0_g1_i1.p1 TRINITY_DN286_c0_g1~~TRINITY_DN286_c0_g1_i1.p1  ORF type:complete len:183 (-),score=41.41 TRINITY_DN286_c0_g1_i1:35-583(-)